MEIKATLEKPCLDDDKFHFYAEQSSRNGYTIKETEEEYQAWGYTEEEKAEMERFQSILENTVEEQTVELQKQQKKVKAKP